MTEDIERAIRTQGEEIFKLMEDDSTSIFNKDWWYGRIMEWSMKNEHFKVQMFRFVDVLPYLKSGSEVARHLKEYFAESGDNLPSIFNFGLGMGSLAPSLMAGAVRKNVTEMAKMFIAGENAQEALPALKKNRDKNIAFTVDVLGEASLSEKEALEYQNRYIDLITWLSKEARNWKDQAQIDQNHLGAIPKVNVSVKLSALYSQVNLKDWNNTKEIFKERLRPIFQLAKENGVFINLDMEQYSLKNMTLEVFKEIVMEPSFRDYPHWGIVIQAYLRDSYQDIEQMIEFSKRRNIPITIRLVKGAYWDYETIDGEQKNWPIPVYKNKKATDANFERCSDLLLKNFKHIHAAIASHNVRSLAAVFVQAKKYGVPQNAFEVQMLYGMADPIKRAVVKMGYRVRQYTPVGELIPGMAYLVRRLLENTSNESFLRNKFADNISTDKLLADPKLEAAEVEKEKPDRFENEALLDFMLPENRSQMQAAIEKMRNYYSKTIPLIIDGKSIRTNQELESKSPSHPSHVLARISIADKTHAESAVQAALKAFTSWKKTDVETRCQLLEKIADKMKKRRFELAATQVLEVGKSWSEADGDVCEAIDFCRYYARDMRRIAKAQRVGHAPGEISLYHYQPRGVAVVIAPWNFPLAIFTGMCAAAAVTGNTVIMKPAEQSSLVAWQLMEIIQELDVPPGVFNFVPGYGEEVGAYLVGHAKTHLIAFTGSREVGLQILKRASTVEPGQDFIKKCIIEMGGKNAIIIDSDADLDEAIQGVLYSAFGFSGQKCSACSRVIVLEDIYERFKERLVEAAKSIKVGFSEDPGIYLGPVVDEVAQKRILNTIEQNKSKYPVLFEGNIPSEGYFVPPTIFDNVDYDSSLAQEEIFGPVLSIIKVKNLDQALQVANSTVYALTGGLYSRSPANIERVKEEFEVGNLYINRSITGALVDRHPFGGFKMSGVGSKTGGPDYLLQFVEPKVVTENTLRRGFAPEEKGQGE